MISKQDVPFHHQRQYAVERSHEKTGGAPSGIPGPLERHSGWKRLGLITSFSLLLALSYQTAGSDRFETQIVDDGTGLPMAATVILTDETGITREIGGEHRHVEYLGKRRCYADGRFYLSPRPEKLIVEVRRGLEFLPIRTEIAATQSSEPVTIRLKRWIDMRGQGYLSGDTHVHFLSQVDSHLQMKAEDLNVLNLLVSDFTHDVDKFTGKLDPISTPGNFVYVGQEARDWQHGHVVLMRIRKIVQPFEPFGGTFLGRNEPNVILARALREAHLQGGVTTWAHFCNLPGTESPIDIALGLVDGVDLITYDDPTQLPSHWDPWKNSGMPQAEFPVMRSMDLYYQYLNAGFRLPIAAGTDKMGENIPVGSNRLYARFSGATDYDAWLEGLKKGNGFVTNGPMLTFEVDGHGSGDVVEFDGSRKVSARARARSILPFASLEIVVNGETAAIRNMTSSSKAPDGGIYSLEIETTLELERSSWIAARVAEDPAIKERILPRGLTVFAHSNPLYYLREGKSVRETSSIQYLQKYMKGSIHWLNTGAHFRTLSEKEEALQQAERARQIYAGL